MKKTTLIIGILALLKLLIQLLGNRNYGFHRDELLHLSVSEHLDWGFMEFPPLIGAIGRLSDWFFEYSLIGTRLFPTLAGVAILMLCCLMAKELKANRLGVILAGVCVLAFVPFYRNHTLFQPVAFDQLFWTLGFYFIIRYFNTSHVKYLLLVGVALGFGLLNKYTMFIWAFGVFVGLIFHQKGQLLKDKWLYLSGGLALLIFLPNLIWQIQYDFPLVQHLQELNDSQLSDLGAFDFLLAQLELPITFGMSLLGIVYLWRSKAHRSIAIATITIFMTMWLLRAKAYYIFALYPILFAAGAAFLGHWLSTKIRVWQYVTVAAILLPMLPFIPDMTPILPIQQYVKYANIESEGVRYELTGDYADMFGWEEQVRLVDSVYRSLSPEERANCVIWAENYGEAGALKILGQQYDLPNPISRHGTFWTWGYDNPDAAVWISLGNEQEAVEYAFAETELVKIITHPYAIGEENGIPLYLCRQPKGDIAEWWAAYEAYVFE
ncbi:MAG: glycosyltransferase family 39 protein [Bacteroidota bacterium]